MTIFQIILLGATAFFAYRIFEHVQKLEDPPKQKKRDSRGLINSPFNPDTLMAQANDAFKRDDLNHAARLLKEAKLQEPDNPEILNRYALVLEQKGDIQEAVTMYETSLKYAPDNDMVHNALAVLLQKNNRLYEAQEHLKAALEIDDTYAVSYYNYGNVLLQMKDTAGAKMMFEKAVQYNPDYEEANTALRDLDENS